MRSNANADNVPASERTFRAVSSVYGNLANVYVNEYFEDAVKTVVTLYFVSQGERFKHFTFVLGKGKTRAAFTDLVVGDYYAEAVQLDASGGSMSAVTEFSIVPSA